MSDLNDEEKFVKLTSKAKMLSKEGSIDNLHKACVLYEKALRIKPADDKIKSRLKKIKEYLKENEDPDDSDVESDDMVHMGDGFYLYKDLHDKLYLHQREGVMFLYKLFKARKGGVLGDDMGMGKTIQIVSFLSGMFDAGHIKTVLIIMPLALIINWINEFERWAPGVDVIDYHGQSKAERAKILRRLQRSGGVCLTSYGIVQKNFELLSQYDHRDFTWDYVILDEGHKVKNPGNKCTQAAHSIDARNRIILSGTPLMNNLMELWAVYDWTHQGQLLGKMTTFKMEYNTPITRSRQKDATSGEQKLGAMLLENLKKKIAPYFLRRVKSDVRFIEARGSGSAPLMPDLTRKNDLICWVYLSEIQQKIYELFRTSDDVKELLNSAKSPLTALVVLKKICDHARLFSNNQCKQLGLNFGNNVDVDALDEVMGQKNFSVAHVSDEDLINESGKMRFLVKLLDHLKETGHRTLVFSLSRHVLDIIEKVMRNRGHKMLRLDGTIKKEERQDIIDRFNRIESYTLFLLTTQVGGVGLTLTAADRVVVFDPSWNPATDSQAVDRVYRIGQTRNVVVYRLITCSTVEEKIYRRQIFKDTINRLMTGDSKNPHRYFSQQDLAELFQMGDPMYSATQVQIQEMYDGMRKTDDDLDAHLAYLFSLEMFGISDHDLMFSTDVEDDHNHDQTSVQFAHSKVQQAEMRMNQECDENLTRIQQGEKYMGGEAAKVLAAKRRTTMATGAAPSAAAGSAASLSRVEVENRLRSIAGVRDDRTHRYDNDDDDDVSVFDSSRTATSARPPRPSAPLPQPKAKAPVREINENLEDSLRSITIRDSFSYDRFGRNLNSTITQDKKDSKNKKINHGGVLNISDDDDLSMSTQKFDRHQSSSQADNHDYSTNADKNGIAKGANAADNDDSMIMARKKKTCAVLYDSDDVEDDDDAKNYATRPIRSPNKQTHKASHESAKQSGKESGKQFVKESGKQTAKEPMKQSDFDRIGLDGSAAGTTLSVDDLIGSDRSMVQDHSYGASHDASHYGGDSREESRRDEKLENEREEDLEDGAYGENPDISTVEQHDDVSHEADHDDVNDDDNYSDDEDSDDNRNNSASHDVTGDNAAEQLNDDENDDENDDDDDDDEDDDDDNDDGLSQENLARYKKCYASAKAHLANHKYEDALEMLTMCRSIDDSYDVVRKQHEAVQRLIENKNRNNN